MRLIATACAAVVASIPCHGLAGDSALADSQKKEPKVKILGKATFESSTGLVRGYIQLKLEECEKMGANLPDDSASNRAHWRCDVFGPQMPIHVYEEGRRYAVSYGQNASNQRAAQQFFGPFNRINSSVFWIGKLREGNELELVATILRFYTEPKLENPFKERPVFVVTQLKEGAVCHTAYVATDNKHRIPSMNIGKASNAAEKAARRLAREPFDCNTEPERIGPVSPHLFTE